MNIAQKNETLLSFALFLTPLVNYKFKPILVGEFETKYDKTAHKSDQSFSQKQVICKINSFKKQKFTNEHFLCCFYNY